MGQNSFAWAWRRPPWRTPGSGLNVDGTPSAYHIFRRYLHMTILDYLTPYRVAHAQRPPITTHLSVLEIVLACGFASSSRFYAAFKKICGRSPRAYRQEHDALPEGQLVALLNSLDERRRPGEPGRS
ncbi:helix-turn-helix transcriptional regulator [Litorilinea aerophila]|nr:helix-turn-helix transcriptional regulator [Litorilinea aerophila]